MELIAAGRTAEVFAIRADRVLKLDRPAWSGVSHFEGDVVRTAHAAGLPVPEVFESVMEDDRHGIVLERVHGSSLSAVLASGADVDACAERFVELHVELQAAALPGLPDLVVRLDDEIRRSGLPAERCDDLRAQLARLARDEGNFLCHFDLHPGNIMVTGPRWVVIDWLTAANGPAIADFARTLLLLGNATDPVTRAFADALRRHASERRGYDEGTVQSWIPIVAAARLAEGFEGPYADWLHGLASDQRRSTQQ